MCVVDQSEMSDSEVDVEDVSQLDEFMNNFRSQYGMPVASTNQLTLHRSTPTQTSPLPSVHSPPSNNPHDDSLTDYYSDGHPSQAHNTPLRTADRGIQTHHSPEGTTDHHSVPLHIQHYLRDVITPTTLSQAMRKMDSKGLLLHFIAFITTIANGTLAPDNIAIMLALERSLLSSHANTTSMRYSQQTKQFWEFMYRLGGGEVIRVMSGKKHFNQVNTGLSQKSLYDPLTGDFNFAVPDERILAKSVMLHSSEIMPGIINECFPLIDNTLEYVLAVDGKKCAQGLRQFPYGDSDLFGYETPTLDDQRDNLRHDLKFIEEMCTVTIHNKPHLLNQARNLGRLICILSIRLKNIRQAIAQQEANKKAMLDSVAKDKQTKSKHAYGVSCVNAFVSKANTCVFELLELTELVAHMMSNLNETRHYNNSDTDMCDLLSQPNCHLLLTPSEIDFPQLLEECPEYIKQRTAEWFEQRKLARVTASTMYNALGLSTLAVQRSHYHQYVTHTKQPKFKPSEELAMEYGRLHEVHGHMLFTCNHTQCSLNSHYKLSFIQIFIHFR